MSYKKIKELIIQSKQGDKKAMEELINTYQKLIKKYTTTYFIKGYEDEDLEQIANMALIQAVKKYDIDNKANFTGFLDVFLRNTFTTMINKKVNTINTYSLNTIVYDDSEDTKEYIDILIDDMNLEEDTVRKEERILLRQALNKLSMDEREVLLAAYSGHGKLKEYAKENGITYKQGRYKRDKALKRVCKLISEK